MDRRLTNRLNPRPSAIALGDNVSRDGKKPADAGPVDVRAAPRDQEDLVDRVFDEIGAQPTADVRRHRPVVGAVEQLESSGSSVGHNQVVAQNRSLSQVGEEFFE